MYLLKTHTFFSRTVHNIYMYTHILTCYIYHAAAPRATISISSPQHEGGAVSLTCQVLAEPDAEVQFLFFLPENQTSVITDSERHTITVTSGLEYYITVYTLNIVDLMTSDAGFYSCSADNIYGVAEAAPVSLEVLGETLYKYCMYT